MSLRLRLTLWHTALLGIVLVAGAVVVYRAVARQLTSQLEYVIHAQALDASRAAHSLSMPLAGTAGAAGTPSTVRRLEVPGVPRFPGERPLVQLVDPSGRLLAVSDPSAPPLPLSPEGFRAALEGQEAHSTLTLPGERVELLSTPVLLDGDALGVLQVAASLQPLDASLAQLRVVLGAVVLGATSLAAVLAWLVIAGALRPVDQLTRTAQEIGLSGETSRRLPNLPPHDELGRLAATFNQVLGRLDESLSSQRRFLADASHDLRTPLAVVRTTVESMLRRAPAAAPPHTASRNDDDDSQALLTIARATERMGRLVADLLALARADAGQPFEHRLVSLDEALLEVYREQRALAGGVRLTIGDFQPVVVSGDPDRIKQLLSNLVDNALRVTPTGGTVTIELDRSETSARLRVRDTGPGIAAEHLDRIFDRFYRVDTPRSRAAGAAGGTGLGLAICRWIAEAHGGHVEAFSPPEGGAVFTVVLPAAVPRAQHESPTTAAVEAAPG